MLNFNRSMKKIKMGDALTRSTRGMEGSVNRIRITSEVVCAPTSSSYGDEVIRGSSPVKGGPHYRDRRFTMSLSGSFTSLVKHMIPS